MLQLFDPCNDANDNCDKQNISAADEPSKSSFDHLKMQYTLAKWSLISLRSRLVDNVEDNIVTTEAVNETINVVCDLGQMLSTIILSSNDFVKRCSKSNIDYVFLDNFLMKSKSKKCSYKEESVDVLTKCKDKVICDSFVAALLSEMAECERILSVLMSNEETLSDDVIFSARGEVVKASRRELLAIDGTYFHGLLSKGAWRTDIIGAYSIDDDAAVLKLMLLAIADKQSFRSAVKDLDSAAQDLIAAKLDYYLIPISIKRSVEFDESVSIENVAFEQITITRKNILNLYYRGALWDPSIHKYSVTVEASSNMNMMIGFAPSKTFHVSTFNYTSCGWYLYLINGTLWAQDRVIGTSYAGAFKIGDVITCIYDASSKEISFEKNGVHLGAAYSNIIGEDIAPAVEIASAGDRLHLFAD